MPLVVNGVQPLALRAAATDTIITVNPEIYSL